MEFVGEEVFGPRNPFLLGAGANHSRWQVQPERSRMVQCWALVSVCSQHTVMLGVSSSWPGDAWVLGAGRQNYKPTTLWSFSASHCHRCLFLAGVISLKVESWQEENVAFL